MLLTAISVWSYKSWASLWASLSSVSSNLHRFKWAFTQLIFSEGVDNCWLISPEIQTVQRFFTLSSKLKLKMKSFLGSLSCIIKLGALIFTCLVGPIQYFENENEFQNNQANFEIDLENLNLAILSSHSVFNYNKNILWNLVTFRQESSQFCIPWVDTPQLKSFYSTHRNDLVGLTWQNGPLNIVWT